jgi:RHS repeat-associated protein
VSKTDARNIKTSFSYDSLNRLTTKTYSTTSFDQAVVDAVNATPPVIYRYDDRPFPTGAPAGFNRGTSLGRLVSVNYNSGSQGSYFGYDELGRVVRKTQQTDSVNYPITATYNRASAMLSETYPSNRTVNYAYEAAGRLSEVKLTGTSWSYASQFSYTPHGAVEKLKLGNGLWEQMSFNSRLQLNEIKLGTDTASDSIFKLHYLYGTVNNPNDPDGSIVATQNNGNLGRIKYTIGGALQYSQTFQYDALNRLSYGVEHNQGVTSNPATWWQKFAYDRWGNRGIDVPNSSSNVTQGGTALQLADLSGTNNRITRSGYTYDGAGNLGAESGGKSYSYDSENKLVTAVVAGTTTNYWYDGEGRRVKKLSSSVTTVFVYNARGQLIAEYTSSVPPYGFGGTKYLTADHLGGTRLVTSGGRGDVKARHDYLPFGEELGATFGVRSSIGGYGGADSTRQKFGSKEEDAETKLYYFNARYYSNIQGRFTSPDIPFVDQIEHSPQSWNIYSYARNNPLR